MSGRSEVTIYRLTLADLDALAGREVTDEEVRSIEKALEFGDETQDVVNTVCGLDDDEEHPEHIDCAIGCRLDMNHSGACRERRGGEPICDRMNHEDEDAEYA